MSRFRIKPPEGELLPAEERLQNALKAIEERMLYEQVEWHSMLMEQEQGFPHTDEAMERQRSFIQGLDIAWSLVSTESLGRQTPGSENTSNI